MRSDSNSITYPLTDMGWVSIVTGGWLVFFGGVQINLFVLQVRKGTIFGGLVILLVAMAVFWLALRCFVKGFTKVHLVPEGIALSLLGRTFRTYPIEKIRMILVLNKGLVGPEDPLVLCISCQNWEELARQREMQLKKNPYMRSNIKFRKQKGDWLKTFALEYLRKKVSLAPWSVPCAKLMYMEYSDERCGFLKQMYPNLPYEQIAKERVYSTPAPIIKNPPPDLRCHSCGETLGCIMLLIPFIPSLLLLFVPLLPGISNENTLLHCLPIIWLFASLIAMLPLDWQRVEFLPEGILIRLAGRKLRFLPVQKVNTIACFDYRMKSVTCRYLSVSSMTPQEMLRQEEKRMMRSKGGREKLEANRLITDWNIIALKRYFSRRVALFGYWDNEQLLIAYTCEREQLMRELYPEAEWVMANHGPININSDII